MAAQRKHLAVVPKHSETRALSLINLEEKLPSDILDYQEGDMLALNAVSERDGWVVYEGYLRNRRFIPYVIHTCIMPEQCTVEGVLLPGRPGRTKEDAIVYLKKARQNLDFSALLFIEGERYVTIDGSPDRT
ncbi:MAG: hypothetical protein ACE5DM_00705 [Candidatus Nanoarchaeia archaeon]